MKYSYKIVRNGRSCSARGKYSISYEVGRTIFPVEGTLGIFCFRTLHQAKDFLAMQRYSKELSILRVKPLGHGKCKEKICYSSYEPCEYDIFYRGCTNNTTNPPDGTVIYPAVKVISQVLL